jgi:transaldolase/glucose-6-phosphate isomerase
VSRLKSTLPESLAASVKSAISEWQTGGKMKRLWRRDASLWTGTDEAHWLGWLDVVDQQIAQREHLRKIADEVRGAGFKHVVLLGMGGSSLGPEVLRMTFGKLAGFPELHVLDSTDPAQVKVLENKIDIPKTAFIVSSKSGSTLEPNIFKQYFFALAKQAVGPNKAGSHFIAITDPGCNRSPKLITSGTYFTACLRSAVAIPCSPISAWCRRR